MLCKKKSLYSILLIFLFFVWILFSILLGEHIPAGSGLGFDGVTYTRFAQSMDKIILNHETASYLIQRIAPSSLIYLASKVFHFSVNVQNAPLLFSILNACMLAGSLLIWLKLAKKLNWNIYVKIISFSGLFLNFANLKMSFYYPTLTDTTAFTLGLLMLYCYVNEKDKWLVAASIVGAFTFPTLLCMGFILFILPCKKNKTKIVKFSSSFPMFATLLQAITIVIISLLLHFVYGASAVGSNYSSPMLFLSILSLFLYVFFALRPMTEFYWGALTAFIKNPIRILFCFLIFIMISIIIKQISNDRISVLTFIEYLTNISNQALAYPFNFIISHFMYYGPIILLFLYFWREVVEYLSQKGAGLFIVTGIYLILSIGSESRQLINFLPMVVFLTAEILNKKALTWDFTLFFAFLSLIVSKCWLPINHGEWLSLAMNPPQITLEFPMQWYFMNFGPWVSQMMYLIHFFLIMVTGLLLYFFAKKRNILNKKDLACQA
ncbi:MAG: hypothetical protein H0U70_06670 [Tatlockia sp.]|nr:hypothetical protein [Tatlockia sp.]